MIRRSEYGLDGVGIESFVAGDCHSVESVRHTDRLTFLDHFESGFAGGRERPLWPGGRERHLDRLWHLGRHFYVKITPPRRREFAVGFSDLPFLLYAFSATESTDRHSSMAS